MHLTQQNANQQIQPEKQGRKRPKICHKREREQQIINNIEIDTHHLVKLNEPIKLGLFRQRPWHYMKRLLKVNPRIYRICSKANQKEVARTKLVSNLEFLLIESTTLYKIISF